MRVVLALALACPLVASAQASAEQMREAATTLASTTKKLQEEILPGTLTTTACQVLAQNHGTGASLLPPPPIKETQESVALAGVLQRYLRAVERHCNLPGGPGDVGAVTAKKKGVPS
jgi:hypothetical protein